MSGTDSHPIVLTPGVHLTLRIEKPVAGGRMLAREQGQVVLVAGAIPGELVRAQVERSFRHVAYARTIDVLEPSADRREGAADWQCGGNVYAYVGYERQRALKAEVIADAFARIARLTLDTPVEVTASPELGYRMRARLHVRNGRIGFFREGTHELCDARQTGQLLPETSDVIERIAGAVAGESGMSVSDLELSENIAGDQRAVHLEGRGPEPSRLASLGRIEGVTGLSASGGGRPEIVMLHGDPRVSDAFEIKAGGGARACVHLQRHARAFFQANRHLVGRLVNRVIPTVLGSRVIDLYAGVGLFAVSLAALGHDVTAVEGDCTNAADLRVNAAPFIPRLRVEHGSVEEYFRKHPRAPGAAMIVDPPRTGMSRVALAGVLACDAPRVVYVSCDVATLARDVRKLVDAGYVLDRIDAFDMFPNTAHVESLVVLNRP